MENTQTRSRTNHVNYTDEIKISEKNKITPEE